MRTARQTTLNGAVHAAGSNCERVHANVQVGSQSDARCSAERAIRGRLGVAQAVDAMKQFRTHLSKDSVLDVLTRPRIRCTTKPSRLQDRCTLRRLSHAKREPSAHQRTPAQERAAVDNKQY